MTARPITDFAVTSQDDCIQFRTIGTFVFQGFEFEVEFEAFSESEEGETKNDYDFETADVFLQCKGLFKAGTRGEKGIFQIREELGGNYSDELKDALKEFLNATVEGVSEVSWGESGAQDEDMLAFGRNGW